MIWLLTTAVASQCVSLETSKYCTELKGYSIKSFQGVSTAAQFDLYLEANAAFNFGSECPNWSSAIGSNIRYSKSTACALAVYLSTKSAIEPCNQGIPAAPALCKSSIQLAYDDVQTNLQKSCPDAKIFSSYSEFLNSSLDDQCLLGFGPDAETKCGIAINDGNAFCSNAANSNQICCKATSNSVGIGLEPTSTISTTSTTTTTSDSSTPLTSSDQTTIETTIETTEANANQTGVASAAPRSRARPGASPLVIGGAALGVILVGMVGSAFFFLRRPKPDITEKEAHNSVDNVSLSGTVNAETIAGAASTRAQQGTQETMEAIFEYQANLFDELTLNVGDEVEIQESFDDGWALGFNLTTQKQGTFPLACLAPFGATTEFRESQYSTILTATSKRASSMFAGSNATSLNMKY